MALTPALIGALMIGEHTDPFAVLGMHQEGDAWVVRALLPGAASVVLVDARDGVLMAPMRRVGATGVFEAEVPAPFPYRLRIDWSGTPQDVDDPYRFGSLIGDTDAWLLAEGTHRRPYERMGAQLAEIDGVAGVSFAV
ncbi:MAG: GlgB N-terminal domain-containing protein, partial [Gammaproteobacteria bacterium]